MATPTHTKKHLDSVALGLEMALIGLSSLYTDQTLAPDDTTLVHEDLRIVHEDPRSVHDHQTKDSLMPRLKPSPGKWKFTTPVSDELQRYLMYELECSRQWNKTTMHHKILGPNRWQYRCQPKSSTSPIWTIEWDGKAIIAVCNDPKIWIRQGLEIDMGNGRIVIGAQE